MSQQSALNESLSSLDELQEYLEKSSNALVEKYKKSRFNPAEKRLIITEIQACLTDALTSVAYEISSAAESLNAETVEQFDAVKSLTTSVEIISCQHHLRKINSDSFYKQKNEFTHAIKDLR